MNYEWSRTTRIFALVTAIMVLLLIAYLGRALIRPLVLSALLAYVFNPLISLAAGRSRLRRSLAVALLYLLILVGLSALGVALAPVIADQAQLLAQEFQNIWTGLNENLSQGIVIFGYVLPLEALLQSGTTQLPEQILQSDLILGLLGAATTNLVWILLIMVTTYYFLQDWSRLREWLLCLPPESMQPDARRLYESTKAVWQGYLRGQLLLSTIIALLTWITLTAIGMPSAGAIGVLNGVMSFIPNIGSTIAMIVAGLVAWFGGSTYLAISDAWFTLIVIVILALIQGVEGVWLRPSIMGRSVQMHPAIVFVAFIGATAIAGIIGGIVIVPVIATLGILGRYLRCRLLGLDPWAGDETVAEAKGVRRGVPSGGVEIAGGEIKNEATVEARTLDDPVTSK